MARKSGGIFERILRLILDKNSVDKTKAELQRALKEGTDPKAAQKNLKAAEKQMGATAKAIKGMLVGFGTSFLAVFGARQLLQMADSWKLISGRLKLVTKDAKELAVVQKEIFAISQRTRTSYEATATLFQRVAFNAEELGRRTDELLNLTEVVNKAIQLGGANATEARAGVIQFSQAIASGVLRGDEFRSLMENLPGLADVLKESLGATSGELREMAFAGELTAQTVVDALLKMQEKVDENFANLPVTVGAAWQVLTNEIHKFVGTEDEVTGTSKMIADALLGVADAAEESRSALDKWFNLIVFMDEWGKTVQKDFMENIRKFFGGPLAPGPILGSPTGPRELRKRTAEDRSPFITPEMNLQAMLARLESERTEHLLKVRASDEAFPEELAELNRLFEEGNDLLHNGNLSLQQRVRLLDALNKLREKAEKDKVDEDAKKLQEKQLDMLREANALGIATEEENRRLLAIYASMNAELEKGNVPLERRLFLAEQLGKAMREAREVPTQSQFLRANAGTDLLADRRDAEGNLRLNAPPLLTLPDPERMETLKEQWLDDHKDLQSAAQNAAMGVAGSWQDAFELIGQEGADAFAFAEALFRGVAGAALGALSQVASAKVANNIASAFDEKAKAVAAFAESASLALLPGGQAASTAMAAAGIGHLAASKGHWAAAAKWALLGGAGAAAQSGIAGGGRGGQSGGIPSGARDPAGRVADRVNAQKEITIITYVDGIDPKSGTHQTLLGDTIVNHIQRRGSRITDGATGGIGGALFR